MYKNNELWVKKVNKTYQVYFKFRGGLDGQMPKSIWYDSKFSASEHGTQILNSIMGERETFQYPKSPYAVIDSILAGTNKKDAIILDFFAGSGTTAHAVLELNRLDGGKRKFILCTNNENGIAEEICYPRISKVIKGYANVTGIPANLRYFKTAFVSRSRVTDDTRLALIKRSTEMICVRENTFKKIEIKPTFRIYQDTDHLSAILYDLDALVAFKQRLEKETLPAHIYIFSLTKDTFDEDFEDLKLPHEICPIPESILEVYRKLFK